MISDHVTAQAQFTPPTPVPRNCRVSSRRQCELIIIVASATVAAAVQNIRDDQQPLLCHARPADVCSPPPPQPTDNAALQRTTQSHSTTGLVLPLVGRFEFMTRCQIHAAPFHGVYIPRTAALQPINFATLTRVTNNASCNWVNLLQVSSVRFGSCAVNSSIGKHVFRTPVQFSSVEFSWSAVCR